MKDFTVRRFDALHRTRESRLLQDLNPYPGETIAPLALANVEDIDQAYAAAARAQLQWAERGPSERSAVFLAAAGLMEKHRKEIVRWLIAESGSTMTEAEWGFTRAGILWAATCHIA